MQSFPPIVQRQEQAQYACSSCGADRHCQCNAPAIPKKDQALRLATENPNQSIRTLAEKAGVSHGTAQNALKEARLGVQDCTPETITGRDGKSYPMPEREVSSGVSFVEPASEEETHTPHVAQNSGNNEWYTPPEFIEAARLVMGGIDTDPASSKLANTFVGAATYFTAEDDGLTKKWSGRVWMNPPYAQPLVAHFADAIAQKFIDGEIEAACVLVNNATETGWFRRIADVATAACFLKGRVKFLDHSGVPANTPLQGQAILYLGPNGEKFSEVFSTLGHVWGRTK